MTGYKIPNTFHTFETEMALFRNVFGAKRDKSGKFLMERAAKESLRRVNKEKRLAKKKKNISKLTTKIMT